MRTACAFCGSQKRKITNEHVFGEWISPLFGPNPPDKMMEHGFGSDATVAVRRWDAYGLDIKVKMACRDCNNTWMSDLENAVKPIISPMIFGARRVLSLREQIALTVWAIKTCMVHEGMHSMGDRYFTQEERHGLKNDAVPLQLGTRIWAGRYAETNDGIRGISTCLIPRTGPRIMLGHLSTFAIGQFALQVLVERRSASYEIRGAVRPGPWNQALISVWPPSRFADIEARGLVWPPVLSLTQQSFYELFKRFSAFGT